MEMTVNSAVKILLVSGLALTTLAGCAYRQRPPEMLVPVALPPPPPPPPPPPRKKVKLVFLPAERFLLPNVAAALNEKLVRAEVPGVDERTVAAISMETAQGQAECAQANDECSAKVATLLGGDRLLWAEMERVSKSKKKGPVKIQILLFDAQRGALISRAEDTFKTLAKKLPAATTPVRPSPTSSTSRAPNC